MEKLSFKIEGMHCMGCALGLEEEIEKLDFVNKVEVIFDTKTMILEVDSEKYDYSKVSETVEKLGFKIFI